MAIKKIFYITELRSVGETIDRALDQINKATPLGEIWYEPALRFREKESGIDGFIEIKIDSATHQVLNVEKINTERNGLFLYEVTIETTTFFDKDFNEETRKLEVVPRIFKTISKSSDDSPETEYSYTLITFDLRENLK